LRRSAEPPRPGRLGRPSHEELHDPSTRSGTPLDGHRRNAAPMKILITAWRDLANELAGGSEGPIDHPFAGRAAPGHERTRPCPTPIGEGHTYPVHPNGGTIDQSLRAPFVYLRHYRDADLVVDVANGVSFYTPFWRRGPSICLVNHIHTEQWDQ